MSAPESWKEAYRELIGTIVKMGYPEEFGQVIAKNLGSEKTMRRMTAYLHSAKPRSAEEIADEMLAIMSDRERTLFPCHTLPCRLRLRRLRALFWPSLSGTGRRGR